MFVPHTDDAGFNLNTHHGGQLSGWLGVRLNGWVALNAGLSFSVLTEEEEYEQTGLRSEDM